MIRRVALAAVLALAGCGGVAATPVPVEVLPSIECTRIPAQTCREIVDSARREADPGTVPVRIRAVCTRAMCTPQGGDASIEVLYSNGRSDNHSIGWAGAVGVDPGPPPPVEPLPVPLPVEPICLGIAAEPCRERAREASESNLGRGDIRGIVVRCTGVCTPEQGTGTTLVTFADGTTTTSDWGYASGG